MKIAIHVADLDATRIDGTRVYMHHVLNHFGTLAPDDTFVLYHGKAFNPALEPHAFENYIVRSLTQLPLWTQTRFALGVLKDNPDVLWMPMANMPLTKKKSLRTVVTIHDLAFKHFPQYFPKKDLFKLNALARMAITQADDIIAVSHATKADILKFFPERDAETIHVVHHGFDAALFQKECSAADCERIAQDYGIHAKKFLLYVGAIQPRKNLETLVGAFEQLKPTHPDLQLVIVGEKAWMWEQVMEQIEASAYKNDIICTGQVPFAQLPAFYQCARAFVFPSLYEGFGIPVLEAFASRLPVVVADNSSLGEVAGDGALRFETGNAEDLAIQIKRIITDETLTADLVRRGALQLAQFSWERCAKETLDVLRKK